MPFENRLSKIGDLDRWVTYKYVTTRDTATGGFVEETRSFGRWARIEARVRGIKEVTEIGQEISFQQVVWVMRYFADYKKVDYIEYEGRIYDIIAANELGRRQYLQFTTELRE